MFQVDEGEGVASEEEEEKEEDGSEERKDEDSDGDGGWITPSNIKQIQQELDQCTVPRDVQVGCVTTDFAMQVGGTGRRLAPSLCHTCHGQWSLGGLGVCTKLL